MAMIIDAGDLTLFNPERFREKLGAVSQIDTRLADARTPKPHTHPVADILGLTAYLASLIPAPSTAGFVPIGAIVAWHKSLPGCPALPPEFLECDGSVVADPASPLNGKTLPDLNGGQQFLRGAAASTGSGGAANHTHSYTGTTDVEDGDTDVQGDSGSPVTVAALSHGHPFAGTTAAADTLPPYTNVVWILRIK